MSRRVRASRPPRPFLVPALFIAALWSPGAFAQSADAPDAQETSAEAPAPAEKTMSLAPDAAAAPGASEARADGVLSTDETVVPAPSPAHLDPLGAFADALAARVVRAGTRLGLSGAPTVTLETGRGVRPGVVKRSLLPLVRTAMGQPPTDGAGTLDLAVSAEDGALWAVGRLQAPDGRELPIAVTTPLDPVLARLVALRATRGTEGITLRALRTVRTRVLDLVALKGQPTRLAALGIDGVSVLDVQLESSQTAPSPLGPGRFRRPVVGWLAQDGFGDVLFATSGGHRGRVGPDGAPKRGRLTRIPLRQAHGDAALLWAVPAARGVELQLPPTPERTWLHSLRFRDLIVREKLAVWVTPDGKLLSQSGERRAVLSEGPVGDRIALIDLDGDGADEVVYTESEPERGTGTKLHLVSVTADGRPAGRHRRVNLGASAVVALCTAERPGGGGWVYLAQQEGRGTRIRRVEVGP